MRRVAVVVGLGLLATAVWSGIFVGAFSGAPQIAVPGTQLPLVATAVACRFPPGIGPLNGEGILTTKPDLVTWTPDAITYLTFAEHTPGLRSARRSDCRETAAIDLTGYSNTYPFWQILAVPGATAVLAMEESSPPHGDILSNDIIGFGS